ncbi:hypothetical protein J6590_105859 [Homalodisca vitripennis]|nr:hypothetical protein J6590_105859 [Homalodisca vitripennis]
MRWSDQVEKDLRTIGATLEVAQDRGSWRDIVGKVKNHLGFEWPQEDKKSVTKKLKTPDAELKGRSTGAILKFNSESPLPTVSLMLKGCKEFILILFNTDLVWISPDENYSKFQESNQIPDAALRGR